MSLAPPPRRARAFLLATLAVAALPGLLAMPWWVAAMGASAMAIRHLPVAPLVKRILVPVVLAAGCAAIALGLPSWFSGEAAFAFLVLAVALKWTEERGRRDILVLAAAGVMLAAFGALYHDDLLGLAFVVATVVMATATLVALEGAHPLLPARAVWRETGRLVGLALPVAAVLFVAFPRIPGPLWDIGLAMGLPITLSLDDSERGLGFGETLEQQAVSTTIGGGNQTVLAARFENGVPYKSQLYWRGPVYWDFDGERWRLSEGWDNRRLLLENAYRSQAAVEKASRLYEREVIYEVRVLPHGGRWLYSLDLPAAIPPESFISGDMQLLSIRPVIDERRFRMRGYLDYATGLELSAEDRARALVLPQGRNPRLVALGQRLRQDYPDDGERVRQAMAHVSGGGFSHDETAPPVAGADALDAFFFDIKRGGVQSAAESFTVLMRAAGVPARLVTGFRGGQLLALTDFIIVKRSHAHAWTETWQEGRGWVRVDALDFIAPPQDGERAPAPRPQREAKPRQAAAPETVPDPEKPKPAPAPRPAASGPDWLKGDWLKGLGAMLEGLERWLVRYGSDRQIEMFETAGFASVDAGLLASVAVVGLGGASLAVAAAVLWRRHRRRDPLARAYAPFLATCARLGLPAAAHDCPRDHARRVAAAWPQLAAWCEAVSGLYLDGRYGGRPTAAALRRQARRFAALTEGLRGSP